MKRLIVLFVFCLCSGLFAETKIYKLEELNAQDLSYVNIEGRYFLDDVNAEKLFVGYHTIDGVEREFTTAVRFDLKGLPDSVKKVELYLYALLRDLGERAVPIWFNSYINPWGNPPLKFNDVFEPGSFRELPAPKTWRWYKVDITDWYRSRRFGESPNEGFALERGFAIGMNAFASVSYFLESKRPRLKIVTKPKDFKLSFPVEGLSPYTTRCEAVMDNDLVKGNRRVLSYNKKWATSNPYVYAPNVIGYSKPDLSDFVLPLIPKYNDGVSGTGKAYLFYDGHSGYDYAESGKVEAGTIISAAASGTLVPATTQVAPDGINVWRNILFRVPDFRRTLQWDANHAFYILHQDGWSTWYLHASDFVPDIKSKLIQSGYVNVNRGDPLAYVGNYRDAGYHLHFGLRKGDVLKDPYGNGTTIPPRSGGNTTIEIWFLFKIKRIKYS